MKSKNPLVSIITPTFNSEKYLEETILSVLNQTYKNIEYIIIDGVSTDKTLEILSHYKDRISKIVSEPDNGLSDAINKGIRIAKGEIFTWIGSDDLLMPYTVETIIPFFVSSPTLGLTFANFDTINESGEKIRHFSSSKINLKNLLDVNPTTPQVGSFYRTEFVKKLGLLNLKYKQAMDYDLFIRLMRNYDYQFINKTLAQFRLHSSNLTTTTGRFYSPKETFIVSIKNGGRIFTRANLIRGKAIMKYFIKKILKLSR